MNGLIDMHTHSSYSPDAEDTLANMYAHAEQIGLQALAVTDHCDCNFWKSAEEIFGDDTEGVVDIEMYGSGKYSKQSIAAQKIFEESSHENLKICVGVELGQPLQNLKFAEQVAADDRLDFIIGSHHQNIGKADFYWLDYSKMSEQEIYELLDDYFKQVTEMCRWGKFDVLGHLTYPLRYIQGKYGIDVDLNGCSGKIDEIFRLLISKGKGIEVNTSGLRQEYGKTFPDAEQLYRFRQLGGEIVTIGSDAHRVGDIGKGIPEGIELIKSVGFTKVAYFKNHQPVFVEI